MQPALCDFDSNYLSADKAIVSHCCECRKSHLVPTQLHDAAVGELSYLKNIGSNLSADRKNPAAAASAAAAAARNLRLRNKTKPTPQPAFQRVNITCWHGPIQVRLHFLFLTHTANKWGRVTRHASFDLQLNAQFNGCDWLWRVSAAGCSLITSLHWPVTKQNRLRHSEHPPHRMKFPSIRPGAVLQGSD